jgi:radical SAM superfamily enzyme YgiQ (UPF0313 family)
MIYSEPLFRPPSEANSLIVQLTEGCSHNQCKFCPMYKTKKYREKDLKELQQHLSDLENMVDVSSSRVFLADGDALSMDTDTLHRSIESIQLKFPRIKRYGIYGSVFSMLDKSVEDLKRLKELGLRYVYLGIESGDEEVLKTMNKYSPTQDIINSCRKVLDSGINLSVMIIIGLGGIDHSSRHIEKSVALLNVICPTYTSLLNLMLDHTPLKGLPVYNQFGLTDYLREVSCFIKNITCRTIFRSNHASNFIPLQGVLPRDREKLLGLLSSL